MADKLYLVTREDLPGGAQGVQAAHASHEFCALFPEVYQSWRTSSNTLALLATDDEGKLQALLELAQEHGYPVAPFYEPDLNDELTAIAIGPQGKRLCRKLRLALG